MIATGLIFLFGVLVATLIALLLAPLVWRKAQRLARRDFDATIPTTANEVRAQLDHARAEAAMTARRQEILAAEAMEKAARERAEAGRIAAQNFELQRRVTALVEDLAARNAELGQSREDHSSMQTVSEQMRADLQSTRRDLELRIEEMDALASRFRDVTDIAEERKIRNIALETKLEDLADELRNGERRLREAQQEAERLRADKASLERRAEGQKAAVAVLDQKVTELTARLADRDEQLARFAGSGGTSGSDGKTVQPLHSRWGAAPGEPEAALAAEEDDIRERISDIAARVIRMTAIAEGPDSPIARLLEGQGSEAAAEADAATAKHVPSLAERVRLLMEADSARQDAARAGESRPEAADQPAE